MLGVFQNVQVQSSSSGGLPFSCSYCCSHSADLYMKAKSATTPGFFALDHHNYATWMAVHLGDMTTLRKPHPDVAAEFSIGHFVVQKSSRMFSKIATDRAHEQNNAYVESDGAAVGLTENPAALCRWMIGGPELSRLIQDFHTALESDTDLTSQALLQICLSTMNRQKVFKTLSAKMRDLWLE